MSDNYMFFASHMGGQCVDFICNTPSFTHAEFLQHITVTTGAIDDEAEYMAENIIKQFSGSLDVNADGSMSFRHEKTVSRDENMQNFRNIVAQYTKG